MTPTDFESEYPTLEELRKEAKRLDIQGRSKMNKEELIKALEADEAERRYNDREIVVIAVTFGEPLIMRSSPTDEDVKGFVTEHKRRHEAGMPGGPDGYPAVGILEAVRYPDEDSFKRGDVDSVGEPIDLSDVL